MIKEIKFEKLNIRKKKKGYKIFIIVICIFLAFNGITNFIKAPLIALCKINSESLATSISGKVVQEIMGGLGYLDLVTLDKDENGSILALRANVVEMNKIATQITNRIQEEYMELEDMYIKIPLGYFTGNELLSGVGPDFTVKIIPAGTVNTDYKTEFISTGINQTRHRIYLEIKSEMTIVAPFTNEVVEVINNVNVAETVLIGNVPDTFYNLEGLTANDTMNLIE